MKQWRDGARLLAALTLIVAVGRPRVEAVSGAGVASLQSLQGIIDERASPPGVGIIVARIGPAGVQIFKSGSSGTGRSLDEHSLFEIGSLTKAFTATLLATMVLDGSVKLDDPVAKYLPKTVHVPGHGRKPITLLSLATHHSGLPALPDNLTLSPAGFARYSVADMYAFVSHWTLRRDPGAAYEYSSLGISLLGQALANRAGVTYGELLRRRVLEPLGMNDTTLAIASEQAERLTVGRDGNDKVAAPLVFGGGLAPATMLHSSIDDMIKFARCNLGQGPLAAACIFAQRPRANIPGNYRIGLAWWTDNNDGIVRHPGNSPGFHAAVAISKDHTKATIALENGGISVDDVAWHTLDASVPVWLLPSNPSSQPSSPSAASAPAASAWAPVSVQAMLDGRTSLPGTGIILAELEPNGISIFKSGTSGTSRPLDDRSIFEIGSVTKTFTGTLLALMVMDGSVKLDDPLQKYLPNSVHVPVRNGKVITLLSLAIQRSGLPLLPGGPRGSRERKSFSPTLSQMYGFVSKYKLKRDPGARYEYSNLGIALLGQALADREGTTYPALLRHRILDPLGMTDTTLVLAPGQFKRLAVGRDAANKVSPPWTFGALAPAGEIRSSIADMLKYARCNMGQGPLASACIFAQGPRDDIGGDHRIGLTWWIDTGDGIVFHSGNVPGYHASIAISPDHSRAAIVLANGGLPVDDVAEHVLDPSVPVAQPSRRPRIPVAGVSN